MILNLELLFHLKFGLKMNTIKLVDADESLWSHVTFLGRILNRNEALEHQWIKDVFHITDHMVTDDKEIVGYFES